MAYPISPSSVQLTDLSPPSPQIVEQSVSMLDPQSPHTGSNQVEQVTQVGKLSLWSEPYAAAPLDLKDRDPKNIWRLQVILGHMAAKESFFTDYSRSCFCQGDFCTKSSEGCQKARVRVYNSLSDPKSMSWIVLQDVDPVGILRLSQVEPGCSGMAHYCFFDGRLRDKTALLRTWKDAVFSDGPGWQGLHRVTIEVPGHAIGLARHAQKHLGFGGPYEYDTGTHRFNVEGVKREAILWRGVWHDLIQMGLINA